MFETSLPQDSEDFESVLSGSRSIMHLQNKEGNIFYPNLQTMYDIIPVRVLATKVAFHSIQNESTKDFRLHFAVFVDDHNDEPISDATSSKRLQPFSNLVLH